MTTRTYLQFGQAQKSVNHDWRVGKKEFPWQKYQYRLLSFDGAQHLQGKATSIGELSSLLEIVGRR
jgi:hypothetical protein